MEYVIHILICILSIVSVELFFRTNYLNRLNNQISAIKKILNIIKNDHSIDSISEKILIESIFLFKVSLMNLIFLIFIISPLLILFIFSHIFRIENFFLLITSIKFELLLLVLLIIYIFIRKKLINRI